MNLKNVLLLMSFVVSFSLFAQKKQAEIFSTKLGAIKGYDPISYFKIGQPQKGENDIVYEWKGAVWHFVNEENKSDFSKNPEKYAPQYGGYCAYGLAKGYKVKIEPDAWSIVDGKLYLNYDKSVQKDWDKDRKGYILKADENWKK